MAKRLIFSTSTPNDQGGIIPNEVIDFSRYNKLPVLLKEHRWGSDPLGRMTDIKFINGQWSGIPVFHLETKESREAAGMYEKDALNAASIGGEALWKKNPVTDDYIRNDQGYKLCEKFFLYEISLVALPSNPDAVGTNLSSLFAPHLYEDSGMFEEIDRQLVTLSSKFKSFKMNPRITLLQARKASGEATPEELTELDNLLTASAEKGKGTPAAGDKTALAATPGVNELPNVIAEVIKRNGSMSFNFAAGSGTPAPAKLASVPAAKDCPEEQQGEKETGEPNPEPLGMAAKAAAAKLSKLNKAKKKADEKLAKMKKAKKEADDEDTEEMKSAYTLASKEAEEAVKECEAAEKEYDSAEEYAADEAAAKISKTVSKKTTFSATGNASNSDHTDPAGPIKLSASEIREQLTLAAAPSFKATVGKESQGVTFTKLNSPLASDQDKKILRDLFHTDRTATQVNLQTHAIALNSILNDSRLQPIAKKVRLMSNVTHEQMGQMRMSDPRTPRGQSLYQLSADINAGRVQYMTRAGNMENLTLLTSTDNALASPALNTIEWLSLAIFQLFPTTSWKSQIPMFGADITSNNTGLILANIVANPTIYKGTSPAPATDYTYVDQAVSLALTPYWLQPMLWKPLDMHQLRYDQMATGWAQAFAKWNSVMDDNLIYTLASTVPAGSIASTSGLSGYQTQPQQFNIPSSGAQNSFYWNPNFAGNLLYPTLNDVIGLEQIYRNQNFELEREKGVLVIDPIMERYFSQDPEMKSLLTAWVSRDGESFVSFKHTAFDVRSRVAVYDPVTGQVKDINSAIPATAMSAALGFIPSQVGMGVGLLDVFMIQDPANYGYRMSADIRIGTVPLRFNFFGTSLLIFGNPNV